jgi:spore coat polysaccharide biosynthesis protein SpsF
MKPRVVAIIQGRMSSSRLPGKILADITGQPMLQRVFIRTSRADTVTETIFATTTDPSDDPVAEYCDFSGIPFTRGSLYDVLDRYYQTAKQAKADVVVRVTADCPIIDPTLIDDVVNTVASDRSTVDFAANRLPPPWNRTYPIGLDTEVCTFAVLERAWKAAKEPQHREHVMPYFYERVDLATVNRQLQTGVSPRGFNIALLHHTTDFGDYRWTVDTPEDLEFIRQVYSRFKGRDDFSWKEVLDLVHNEPDLAKINSGVQHKTLKDIDERASKRKKV